MHRAIVLACIALLAAQTPDPFVGTWTMNPEKSAMDPNHRAARAKVHWERDGEAYLLSAEGVNAAGKAVKETPQRFVPDGKERPVPAAPGVTITVTRPDPHTLLVESEREGQIVGRATYEVSRDGKSLTATVSGTDAKQRPFKTRMVFDRDPANP
ncbi:MAG: hypothetical protein SFV54_23320 [Bryobacteraceae bacterium]|nr:hypothetical protein [Bryobacteraceae bacterium]